MEECTLTTGDIQYISFYLKEKDPTTGTLTPYTLATASSIVFTMREYHSTINTISAVMETVTTPSNTLGFCRVLVTIPAIGTYSAQVEVFEAMTQVTWHTPTYVVRSEFG